MTGKEDIINAMRNLTLTSWTYPTHPIKDYDLWLKKHIKKNGVISGNAYDEGLIDPNNMDDSHEMFQLIYLLENGFLTETQISQLLKGTSYGSSCYGDWRDVAKNKLGIRFT